MLKLKLKHRGVEKDNFNYIRIPRPHGAKALAEKKRKASDKDNKME